MVIASDNDLPQKIDVVIKLSYDNGKTWTRKKIISGGKTDQVGYGDPALIVDRQMNAIFCLFTSGPAWYESTPSNPERNYYCISYDNGETWSSIIEITDQLYGKNC